ncbi:MAG: sensor histidine kinase [Erysipelotrichaceae bacterium]|nr:sensor histidine kinase [Erysipelotrichaceae bacterium]
MALLAIVVIFNLAVLSLAHIESQLISYLTVVNLFFVGVGLIFDWYCFRCKYLLLQKAIQDPQRSLSYLDFKPRGLEGSFLQIITGLNESLDKQNTANRRSYQVMINYYTLWVHQIKTPIAALKLLTQEQGNNLMIMELIKIEQYVAMVLEYLRLEDIHNDLNFARLSLEKVVAGALKKQAGFFAAKKIGLDLQIQDVTILSDEKWLTFALEQVLSNALKYTRQGKITIYNEGCRLYIKDTGIGIDPSDLPRVFERGFTGVIGRQDKKASGLGLYLTKRILDTLNHPITIESIRNQGTTVMIDCHKKQIDD